MEKLVLTKILQRLIHAEDLSPYLSEKQTWVVISVSKDQRVSYSGALTIVPKFIDGIIYHSMFGKLLLNVFCLFPFFFFLFFFFVRLWLIMCK